MKVKFDLIVVRNIIYAIIAGFTGYYIHCKYIAYYIAINYFYSNFYKLMNHISVIVIAMIVWIILYRMFERKWSRLLLCLLIGVCSSFWLLCIFAFEGSKRILVLNPILSIKEIMVVGGYALIGMKILLFIPLGILFYHSQNRILIGIGSGLALELLQYILKRGNFETFDICLYMLGFILGIATKTTFKKTQYCPNE